MVSKVAILHEGTSGKSQDNWLLKALTEELSQEDSTLYNWNRVECYGMGVKSNFFKSDFPAYKRLTSLIENDQEQRILFVMDADDPNNDAIYGGCENTTKQWQTFVEQNFGGKLANISALYVTCQPNTNTGYVESLLLSTLDETRKTCIENFLNCSDFKAKENHKAILNQIYKKAYPSAPYDLKHAHFQPLKEALRQLFSA